MNECVFSGPTYRYLLYSSNTGRYIVRNVPVCRRLSFTHRNDTRNITNSSSMFSKHLPSVLMSHLRIAPMFLVEPSKYDNNVDRMAVGENKSNDDVSSPTPKQQKSTHRLFLIRIF